MAETKHTYEYDIDLTSDTAPARVLRMVERGKKVLEIGAGPGSITRHLSGTLGCEVSALEVDQTAFEKLRPHVKNLHTFDLNDPSWPTNVEAVDGKFDVVIAADVLEHVYDPWRVLNGMKSLLNDTGYLVLSIPHVGHASIAACLLDEDFEYRQWGLLDRTHIRFFGIKNLQHLYASQGLAIEHAEFVVRSPEMTEFVHRWIRLPRAIRDVLERNRFAHVYQVVVRAVPAERARTNLQLMDMTVPPPDRQTAAMWRQMMARIRPSEDSDTRSTIETASRRRRFRIGSLLHGIAGRS